MTENEWLTCANPEPMLSVLRGRASARKARHFACACCRRVWHLFKHEASRQAVEVAERFADGRADDADLEAARRSSNITRTAGLGGTTTFPASRAARACTDSKPSVAALEASRHATEAGNLKRERREQARLLRCVLGNPFHPMAFDSGWRTSTAVALASGIYEECAFDRLPILADALQDAGCEDEEILTHCRVEIAHTRGCWVLDAILGKE